MNNKKSALLLMDIQPSILDRVPDADSFLKRAATAVAHAQSCGYLIIHVVVGFRPGFPEISPHNKSFAPVKPEMRASFTDPRPSLPVNGNEIVVTKRRVSAFSGSDLDTVLRAQDIDHLILGGIATSGAVLSTLREAADKDYELTILSDLCFDGDPDVHAVLLGKIFPRQADVITSEEWLQTTI